MEDTCCSGLEARAVRRAWGDRKEGKNLLWKWNVYPLAPHYVIHVGDDGTVLLPFTQAKQILDRLKKLCIGRDLPDAGACTRYEKDTSGGKDMSKAQQLPAKAVTSVVGRKEERAIASLFTPGGTHAKKGEFQGINDFEVVAFLVVLPEAAD